MILFAALPAAATITVYTDRNAWEASLGATPVTEDFSGEALGDHDTPFTTAKGTALTVLSGDPITIQVFDSGLVNGSRELHFRDFAAGVGVMLPSAGRGFGFDYDTAIESWAVQVEDLTKVLPANSQGFIGFIDDSGPIISFTLVGSLAGGAQGGISLDNLSREDVSAESPGERHNRGLQFILEHTTTFPAPEDAGSVALAMTKEYCASVGRDCSRLTAPSQLPQSPKPLISQLPGSRALQRRASSIFNVIDIRGQRPQNARSLSRFEGSLGMLESSYQKPLTPTDASKLSDLVSVAQSSGRFWASKGEGGLGGINHLPAPIAGFIKIDWGAVVRRDVMGCLIGLYNSGEDASVDEVTDNCVDGAIFFSAFEIFNQGGTILF